MSDISRRFFHSFVSFGSWPRVFLRKIAQSSNCAEANAALRRASNGLKELDKARICMGNQPGGLFVFDIMFRYYLKQTLSNLFKPFDIWYLLKYFQSHLKNSTYLIRKVLKILFPWWLTSHQFEYFNSTNWIIGSSVNHHFGDALTNVG